jgi:cardiolipin synthase
LYDWLSPELKKDQICTVALWPFKAQDIPNLITSLRILLVPPFLWLLLQERYEMALLLFMVAGISDALDGFLAKHYGWTSELGGILDPIADKLLLVGALLTLAWLRELPVWLVTLAILRDAVIIVGAISYHLMIERVQARPLLISKLNTLIQLVLVFTIIIHYGLLTLPSWLVTVLIYLTTLTTVASGTAYVWQWGRLAWQHAHAKNKP